MWFFSLRMWSFIWTVLFSVLYASRLWLLVIMLRFINPSVKTKIYGCTVSTVYQYNFTYAVNETKQISVLYLAWCTEMTNNNSGIDIRRFSQNTSCTHCNHLSIFWSMCWYISFSSRFYHIYFLLALACCQKLRKSSAFCSFLQPSSNHDIPLTYWPVVDSKSQSPLKTFLLGK